MRYAILGDIHSNWAALEAVLQDIETIGVDVLLCVGDVVGYGGSPGEVIQILRETNVTVVKGNHDAAATGELDLRLFNPFARTAAEWTTGVLNEDELEWLRDLPLVSHQQHCAVAHGTFVNPERYDYIQCTEDADPSLEEMSMQVCFVGHTHVPVSLLRPADNPHRTAYTIEEDVHLSDVCRALINVGSVGQPRDEDPRAAWGLYDSAAEHFHLSRVEYDVAREASRIRAAGLPTILADRLFLGI